MPPDGHSARRLSRTGVHASIDPCATVPDAAVLRIGGAEQSHVDRGDPQRILYEYLRRIAFALDVFRPAGAPISIVHLGAGALTLPRYVEATRPGSQQTAVDWEPELFAFVLEALPLAPGTRLETRIGDAREQVMEMFVAEGRPAVDAVVIDIFTGSDSPAHLANRGFYAELAGVLKPDGILVVNIGDEPGLRFAAAQISALEAIFPTVAVAGETNMFTGRFPGNLVALASAEPFPRAFLTELRALGPHPGLVLDGVDLDRFGKP